MIKTLEAESEDSFYDLPIMFYAIHRPILIIYKNTAKYFTDVTKNL